MHASTSSSKRSTNPGASTQESSRASPAISSSDAGVRRRRARSASSRPPSRPTSRPVLRAPGCATRTCSGDPERAQDHRRRGRRGQPARGRVRLAAAGELSVTATRREPNLTRASARQNSSPMCWVNSTIVWGRRARAPLRARRRWLAEPLALSAERPRRMSHWTRDAGSTSPSASSRSTPCSPSSRKPTVGRRGLICITSAYRRASRPRSSRGRRIDAIGRWRSARYGMPGTLSARFDLAVQSGARSSRSASSTIRPSGPRT